MRRIVAQSGASPATFRRQIRALGAIAHFDPSWGASDDGTTSTWVDCIGGATVQSVSGPTRLTYQSASTYLNNRPGWRGNGSSQYLRGGAALSAMFNGGGACSVYTVSTLVGALGTGFVFSAGSTTAQETIAFGALSTGNANHRRRVGATIDSLGGVFPYSTGIPFVNSTVFSSPSLVQWSNGGPTQPINVITANPTNLDVVSVGVSIGYTGADTTFAFFQGDIGDIVVFNTAHSAEIRRYVEQLLAIKYGWPVLQGIRGFTTSNYAKTANGLGLRGGASAMWFDILFRLDATPSVAEMPFGAYETNKGYLAYSLAGYAPNIANGTTVVAAPSYGPWSVNEIGKLGFVGGAASGAAAFTFRNGGQVGTSTALTGYQAAGASIPCAAGTNNATNPATSFTLFGVGGGDVSQNAANAAARAAAIKAASRYVVSGGATPSHGWRFDGVRASYADLVGSDAMARQGTLTAAQIIVTSWPW